MLNGINLMRSKWAADWENQKAEILECHKKLNKVMVEQEDIELKRDEMEEKVMAI